MIRRDKLNINEEAARLQVLSALVSRAQLSASLGQQTYGGDRDVYQALGYPTQVKFSDYASRYARQDIATAVIDRPVNLTWEGDIAIQESKKEAETPLEKSWKQLCIDLELKSKFIRIDKISGIGCYGILLLGLDDVKNPEGFAQQVKVGARKLLYVKPYSEASAKIEMYEEDTKNPRYGKPLLYAITTNQADGSTSQSNTMSTQTIRVHYSRVIHIVDGLLENDVIGTPRLQSVFNRLIDLEKLVGGDAEMFWRGARPGYQGVVDKEFQMTDETKEDMKDQIAEYEHNLRRILINEGVKLEALTQAMADPLNHVEIQIQMISAATGIPKRILTGTERGELSSNQDSTEWKAWVKGRRKDHAETQIVRPFIERCILYGVLPKTISDEYTVVWSDLFAMSEKERIEVGKNRTSALKEYVSTPMAEDIVPPAAFFEFFLGFDDDQQKLIKEMVNKEVFSESFSLTPPPPVMNPGGQAPIKGKASVTVKPASKMQRLANSTAKK